MAKRNNIFNNVAKNLKDVLQLMFTTPALWMTMDGESAWYDNYFGVITLDAYINCKILVTPGKYDFKPYAYGFQKDSPFLPLFDYYLNQMKSEIINQNPQTTQTPLKPIKHFKENTVTSYKNNFVSVLTPNKA